MNRLCRKLSTCLMATLVTASVVGCGATGPQPSPTPDPTPAPNPTPDPNPTPQPTPSPDPDPFPRPAPEEEQDPSGVWRYQTGPIGQSFDYDFEFQFEYLVLNSNGTMQLSLRSPSTGALRCWYGIHSVIEDTLFINIDYDYDDFFGFTGFAFFFMPDENTLELIGVRGELSVLTREPELPQEFDCGTLNVLNRFDDLAVRPDDDTGLAFDGTVLWFTDNVDRKAYPIAPQTGTLGAPLDLTNGRYVHAAQGLDFWTHDQGPSAKRLTRANAIVDEVNTSTDLAEPLQLEALAFDSVDNVLWMHGYNSTDRVHRFLKVNAEVEPDALLDKADFDQFLLALTWDGASLWAITGYPQSVIQIDASTMKAIATYRVPDGQIEWQGIAAIDSSLFLIGDDYRNRAGVLIEVQPQP